jgi:hypothetical protein
MHSPKHILLKDFSRTHYSKGILKVILQKDNIHESQICTFPAYYDTNSVLHM